MDLIVERGLPVRAQNASGDTASSDNKKESNKTQTAGRGKE
jgi:hypothetical protein